MNLMLKTPNSILLLQDVCQIRNTYENLIIVYNKGSQSKVFQRIIYDDKAQYTTSKDFMVLGEMLFVDEEYCKTVIDDMLESERTFFFDCLEDAIPQGVVSIKLLDLSALLNGILLPMSVQVDWKVV